MKTQIKLNLTGIIIATLLVISQKSNAHCEIPCGIYEDSVRVALIKEHITTIEKSMKQILELSESPTPNYNQLVRWVNNKEEHAEKIQDIVSQYFMHQRIKSVEPANEEKYNSYIKQLTLLHKLQVLSMKAKQTTDLNYIDKLQNTIVEFENSYFHRH